MADTEAVVLRPIGWVESSLRERMHAPRQSDEGAPSAWLVLTPEVHEAMRDIAVGDDLVVITWLHRADRDVRVVRPRGAETRPATGVFSTRSPDRPNPLGLHDVRVVEVDATRIRVASLEAIGGTPVLDLKSRLGPIDTR
jgi:tRNA-Thr(GGU) m(6)t(6)A37 methyltransferase TsaA